MNQGKTVAVQTTQQYKQFMGYVEMVIKRHEPRMINPRFIRRTIISLTLEQLYR